MTLSRVRSGVLVLPVTCGRVCMTKEMQSLAQAITVCLVCTIYMKYIFIRVMLTHKIAPLSFPKLSFAPDAFHFERLCLLSSSPHPVCVFFPPAFLLLFFRTYCTHKCTWITPHSWLLLQRRAQQPLIWKEEVLLHLLRRGSAKREGNVSLAHML